jgi:hypothetical protein
MINKRAAFLAAVMFLISIVPQAGTPRIYNGVLALIFIILGLRSGAIKKSRKLLCVSLCVVSYIAALFSKGIISIIFAVSGNVFLYLFAALGIGTVLEAKPELSSKLNKTFKFLFVVLMPVFYVLLIYFYGNKSLFFFVSIIFNAISLGLLFILYLSYLVKWAVDYNENIFIRLFAAAILEGLTISMYQSPWFLKILFK